MRKTAIAPVMMGALLWGCSAGGESRQDRVVDALRGAVDSTRTELEKSLVYVQVSGPFGRGGAAGQAALTGIVLDADGHILLTANLPKDRLEQIKVWVGDEELEGEFVKSDSRANLTLIRIEPTLPLHPATLGVVADPLPGEWVVAVTATGENTDYQKFTDLGVVRGVMFSQYDRFDAGTLSRTVMQGSPVANLDGQIVGVTQNRAVVALRDLLGPIEKLTRDDAEEEAGGEDSEEKGNPWLGMNFVPVQEAYAELSNRPENGVWVFQVVPDSPADRAGLHRYDQITAVDGRPLNRSGRLAVTQLNKYLDPEIGREVTFTVLRNSGEKTFTCEFVKQPETDDFFAEDLGIRVREVTEELRWGRPIYVEEGVLVTGIQPGSPAAQASRRGRTLLRQNDVIVELDGTPTPTLKAFKKAWEGMRAGGEDVVLVRLHRGHLQQLRALNLELGNSKTEGQ